MDLTPETPREYSFCNHAIKNDGVFIIPDARADDRFSGNPLVEGPPYIRFYAGTPLSTENGIKLGALCILSPEPRPDFSPEDQSRLQALAGVVMNEMQLRLSALEREKAAENKETQIKSELTDAYYRIKNKLEYSELIAEIQSGTLSVEKLSALAIAAWEQHVEADGVLANSIRSLRNRMPPHQYKALLKSMPGFAM